MLQFGTLDPEGTYVVDLIQEQSGQRYIRVRLPSDPQHANTALVSKPYSGDTLNEFATTRQVSNDVVTVDDEPFGLDAHDTWMTLTEVKYWRENRSQDALFDKNAPWVNGVAPLFAPA